MCIKKNAGLLNPVESEVVCKVLEEPANSDLESDNEFIPPKTEMEHFLVKVWAELFHRPQVGTQDNFFDLGGHSLLAIQLVTKIYQRYQVELLVGKIYELQTIFKLAQVIEASMNDRPQPELAVKVNQQRGRKLVEGVVPLTPSQAWRLNIQSYQPDHFNISRLFEVDSNFDPDRLQQVLTYLWKMHDALRARFILRRGCWRQIIANPDQSSPDFYEYNLADTPLENEERVIEEYAELLQGSINITHGPLMLVAYLNFGPKRPGRLILIIHHFLVDAISMVTLVKDLQTAYQQLCEGHLINLPEKGASIKEWAELLHEYVLSDEHLKTIDYLLTLPWGEIPGLPLDYPQNHDQNLNNSSAKVTVSLTKEETIILNRKVPLMFNTEVENILLWALTKVISEWTGSKLVEIALTGNGRDMILGQKHLELTRTLGLLVTRRTLLLENIKSADWSQEIVLFCEQIKRIPNKGYDYFLAASLDNNNHVAKQLQQIRSIKKYINYSEIVLNYRGSIIENNDNSELKLIGLSCGLNANPQNNRLRNFNILGDIINHCLNINWEYSYNLYKKETIERLAGEYIHVLKDLIQKLAG